eukprot:TRINITY_DN1121_c0_g1_i1.p1 TRINITY_DN1121_c0_g1~~TRINITY_DN1121_c0_g1_i1.p1  ORF type:complete len:221 (-),score=24.33 TRINITY_DN1121_c0_g1_i1:82-723(-)
METIEVSTLSGERLSVGLGGIFNVADLKELLQKRTGIPSVAQRLHCHGKLVDNHVQVSNLAPRTTWQLALRPLVLDQCNGDMLIRVANGPSFTIHSDATATVAQIKEAICEMTQIPVEKQLLVFAGVRLLDDAQCRLDYRIYAGASVHVVSSIPAKSLKASSYEISPGVGVVVVSALKPPDAPARPVEVQQKEKVQAEEKPAKRPTGLRRWLS